MVLLTPRMTINKTNTHSDTVNTAKSLYDDPLRLAQEFLAENPIPLRFYREAWWAWNGLSWNEADPTAIKASITVFVHNRFKTLYEADGLKKPQRLSTRLINGVTEFASHLSLLPQEREFFSWLDDPTAQADRNYITFNNGILHIPSYLDGRADYFIAPREQWFSPVHLDFPFSPQSQCPKWLAFLDEVLGQQDTALPLLLQELFGYCLIPDTTQEKFFLLTGTGRNGKSTIVEVLSGVLGRKNVSHVSLESFIDKFSIIATENKLVNIMAEITKIPAQAEGLFKEFVSGKPCGVQAKYRDVKSMIPTARCVCTANALPPIKDHSDGFWRRLILIPFKYQVPEEMKDTELLNKLLQELPGIALWALRGLGRLREQKSFTLPTACAAALAQYRDLGDPIGVFLKENFEQCDLKEEIPITNIIEMFYSDSQGEDKTVPRPGQMEMVNQIERLFPLTKSVRKADLMNDGKKQRFVKGLKQKNLVASQQYKPAGASPIPLC